MIGIGLIVFFMLSASLTPYVFAENAVETEAYSEIPEIKDFDLLFETNAFQDNEYIDELSLDGELEEYLEDIFEEIVFEEPLDYASTIENEQVIFDFFINTMGVNTATACGCLE